MRSSACRGYAPDIGLLLDSRNQAEGGRRKRLHRAVGKHDLPLEVDRRHRIGPDLVEREELVDAHVPVGLERLVAAGAVLIEERAARSARAVSIGGKLSGQRRQDPGQFFQLMKILETHRAFEGLRIEERPDAERLSDVPLHD